MVVIVEAYYTTILIGGTSFPTDMGSAARLQLRLQRFLTVDQRETQLYQGATHLGIGTGANGRPVDFRRICRGICMDYPLIN